MSIDKTIKERFSCRAYLEKEVDKTVLNRILETAKWAPSGANTQPWEVSVVRGRTLKLIKEELVKAVEAGDEPRQEFDYYPKEWFEPVKTRRFRCGMALYKALGIGREDKDMRKKQWIANYRFFDAPAVMFFFVDKRLSGGALIDVGAFMQSVMLSAVSNGLGSCPQASLAYYPDIVKTRLDIAENKRLVFGVSMGYPDMDAPVNCFRTEREPVSVFTSWFE